MPYKRRTVISSWLLSYMLILLLAAVAAIFAYRQAIRYAQEEMEKVYQSAVEQLQYTLDQSFSEMRRVALELSCDEEVTALFSSANMTNDEHYAFYKIQKNLHNYAITNTDIYEVAVGYKMLNTVVSNKTTYEMNYYLEQTLPQAAAQTLFSSAQIERYYIVPLPDANNSVFYSMMLPLEPKSTCHSFIVIRQNPLVLQRAAQQLSGKALRIRLPDGVIDLGNVSEFERLPQEEYRVMHAPSSLHNMSYELYVNRSEFDQSIARVNFVAVLCLILAACMCGVVLFFSIRRNYSPISRLLKAADFPEDSSSGIFKNELEYIHAKLLSMKSENVLLEQRIDQTEKARKDTVLTRLLTSQLPAKELAESVASFCPACPDCHFAVIGIHPRAYHALFHQTKSADAQEENYYLLQYIIANIFCDSHKPSLITHVTSINSAYFVLVCGNAREIEAVQATAQTLPRLLHSIFNAQVQVALSSLSQATTAIPTLYQEARDGLEYCLIFEQDFTSYRAESSKLVHHTSTAMQFAQASRNLRQAVSLGDSALAQTYVEEAISCCNDDTLPPAQVKMYMNYLVDLFCDGLLAYCAPRSQLEFDASQVRPCLGACTSLLQLHTAMQTCLKTLSAAFSRYEHLEKEDLQRLLLAYIEKNYADCNLNVSSTAEAFQMTVSSLSQTFKKMAGTGVLEYITQVRIEKAKQLLRQTDFSIAQIAINVGYNDASTFIRNFKKCEGVSPGKYRQFQALPKETDVTK